MILDLYLIADNGSDHPGQAAAGRLRDAHPNAIMIHTPVHASWLIRWRSSFPSSRRKSSPPATSQAWAPSAMPCSPFVHRYNRTALPFNWKFTADDLTAPLRRISQREQSAADQQATLSQAA